MSYLDSPRIHFSGYFQSDVSTVNNNVCYYDSDAFKEQYQEYGDGGWNPQGTAIFRFVSCSVTGASLNGKPITSSAQDPIIGMAMENADCRAPGKMADLDPQQQMVSQIWVLQVRLTDNVERALFIGDMLPVGFMNLWLRQQHGVRSDQQLAANYQSILENVQWHGTAARRCWKRCARPASTACWPSSSICSATAATRPSRATPRAISSAPSVPITSASPSISCWAGK